MNRHKDNPSNLLMTSPPATRYKDVSHAAAADAASDEDDDDDDEDDYDDDVRNSSTLHKVDEAPEDLDAFFVHPLTAASRATDDGDALALLHEYRNLPVLDVHLSATKLKSSLSSSSSSSSSSSLSADMINSDRVTSSSDDLSHVITSSPSSAARRHGDDVHGDDVVDVDSGRNPVVQSRLTRDKTHALSDSSSAVFTHPPSAPQIKRTKLKEASTTDFDDVVSSQYESYGHDDDNDGNDEENNELSVLDVSGRLQRQRSRADDVRNDDNYEDASWRQDGDNMTIVSQSDHQNISLSSSSLSSWVSAVSSPSRRKRKASSSRRYCATVDRGHNSQASYTDINTNKLACRGIDGEFSAVYRVTDESQTSREYYTADQISCRNPSQNELDHDVRQGRNEQQLNVSQYQLEYDLRPSRCDEKPGASRHCRQNELDDDLAQPRSLDDRDVSQYELDYDIQPSRHDEGFHLSQYYGYDEIRYDIRPAKYHERSGMPEYSRSNEIRPVNHNENSTASPCYRQNNPGQVRHREKSNMSELCGQNKLQNDMRSHMQNEGSEYGCGKTDLQYASRYCEVTSTVTPRTANITHTAVPIKSSPDDPDTDQLHDASALMPSLPLPSSTSYYWSSSYGGKSGEGMKDAGGWRADELAGAAAEHTPRHSSTSALYEPSNLMTNFIKVEDALNQDVCQSATAVTLPPPPPFSNSSSSSSLSSSSSPFDHLKRELLAQRNVEDSNQRRRRHHNPSLSTTTAHTSAQSSDNNPRIHNSTPTSDSSAADVGYLPARLPFSLPPVPPGYRLVITHRPTADPSDDASQVTQLIIDHPSDSTTHHSTTTSQPRGSADFTRPSTVGGSDVKLGAAERPQSLDLVSAISDVVLPVHSGTGGGAQTQGAAGVRLQNDRLASDILEQSLRAANVITDLSITASLPLQPRTGASLSLACTPTSSVAASVAHPLGSSIDCVLDYSQQQRLSRRRHNDTNIINNNYNNNNVVVSGRHSLSDIMTPTSDVTTASSPSESLSQDDLWLADGEDRSHGRCPRDNSAMTSSSRRHSSTSYEAMSSFTRRSHISVIPKIDDSHNEYNFYLEAAISTSKQVDEDRLTYLNKGQYYGLVITYNPTSPTTETAGTDFQRKSTVVRSVVMVLFRERHSFDEEQTAWELWHMRQHSFKQRVIDVDAKVCGGAAPLRIDEIAYNAVAVVWNTRDRRVKVNIAVNCLSTDFSHQKGIKGSPLHLQVDTFEDGRSTTPVHRAYSQIKVFCDKGADRKTREEERKLLKRTVQGEQVDRFQKPCDRTHFYSMADLTTRPLLFHPHSQKSPVVVEHDRHALMRSTSTSSSSSSVAAAAATALCNNVNSYNAAASRFDAGQSLSCDSAVSATQRVLLYVRKQHDHVFTALILDSPTVHSLLLAIQEKYNVAHHSVKNVYRRSKKSLLAHLDDNFIRHFANELTFIIDITPHNSTANISTAVADAGDDDGGLDVTLTEIDVCSNSVIKHS